MFSIPYRLRIRYVVGKAQAPLVDEMRWWAGSAKVQPTRLVALLSFCYANYSARSQPCRPLICFKALKRLSVEKGRIAAIVLFRTVMLGFGRRHFQFLVAMGRS